MSNKIVRRGIVWAVSILLVCGIVGGSLFAKEQMEQKKLEAQYEPPKAAMSQEEMEALYDEHKVDESEAVGTEDETGPEAAVSESEIEGWGGTEGAGEEVLTEDAGQSENTVAAKAEQTAQAVSVYEGCPVNFAGMWEVNQDVYAWITIPGTVIDYPILQHATDNTYYLNYNIDGSYGYPGCIYTENMNSRDFTDNNTVIYGHNMKNGTMFAGLHKFEDASFFEKNNTVFIYTPEKQLTYTIFAAYIYDDRHLLYSFNFADEAVYTNYLNEILNMRSMNANIRSDIAVTGKNKIITLVTCMANQPDKRLLVQAVLQEG